MKLPSTLILIVIFCATLAQSQYVLKGGTPVSIEWNYIRDIHVPRRVEVTLTPLNLNEKRTNFPVTSAVRNRMNEMNRRREDDRGHIIASQLGGPAELWNLFPQSRNMNRNLGLRHILQSWYGLENRIAGFLKDHPDGSVNYQITFSYNNRQEPTRPSHVTVSADFSINGHTVNQILAPFRNGDAILGVPCINRRGRPVG